MPQGQRTPTGVKVLIGCAVVGALLGGGALALVLLAGWWIMTPGAQVDTRGIIGEDSIAAIGVRSVTSDPGARAWLDAVVPYFLQLSQQARAEDMPEDLQWLQALQQANTANTTEQLESWMPTDATLVLDRSGDAVSAAFAVNPQAYVRVFKTLFAMDPDDALANDGRVHEYSGREIYDLHGDFMTFDGGTLIGAGTLEQARATLDRIDLAETPPLKGALIDLQGEWLVAGVTTDLAAVAQYLYAEEDALAGLPEEARDAIPDAAELEAVEGEGEGEGEGALEGAVAGDSPEGDPAAADEGVDDPADLLADLTPAEITHHLDFQRGWLGAKMPSGDELHVHISLLSPDAEHARQREFLLPALCDYFRSEGAQLGLVTSCDTGIAGSELTVDAWYSGLIAATRASMDAAFGGEGDEPAGRAPDGAPDGAPAYGE
jgi:hypothetical protein